MTLHSLLKKTIFTTTIAITMPFVPTTFADDPPPSVNAEEKTEKATNITIDHLLGLKTPDDVQISPDGEWVAYVVRRADEEKDKGFSQIWMTSADGKETLPLTAAYANASSPRWNPTGNSIAFLGARGSEDAKSQVWLLNRKGGEAQQYTKVEQGIESFAWSPDGKTMLLTITDLDPEKKDKDGKKADADKDKPKPWVIDRLQFKQDYVGYLNRLRSHLYLFDGEKAPVQITSGDYDDDSAVWSPDSTQIAFVSKRDGDPDSNNNSDIWIVAADASAKEHPLTQVTVNKGSDTNPTWSPDGKSIAYVTVTEPEKLWYATQRLAVKAISGEDHPHILTKDYDRMVYRPKFGPKGKFVYFIADDKGNGPLVRAKVKTGAVEIVTKGDLALSGFDLHDKGGIATIQSSYYAPADVHFTKKGKTTQLSKLNAALLDGVPFGKVERLTVPGWNKEPVESFVYYPANYEAGQAYPTIFVLHGGPVSQHDAGFNSWGQLYASKGYIAVLPNPHGSSGYGEPFTYALYQKWGVPDFADVDATADYLVANGISDGNKLGVGGWSYGGILTNYMITKSTRFKGAVSGASEVNHRANYGHDIYQHFWEVELGLPWENIAAWEAINPFNDLGKVTTPTLVIGGKEDWNVPIQNSEQLYQALKRRGLDTQLVVYPGEFHGIRRPSFIRDRYERYLGWFNKYVKGD